MSREIIIEVFEPEEHLVMKLRERNEPLLIRKGELIRCKDCKHYWESAKICSNTGTPLNDYCEPSDYCSKAERKEE